MEIRERCKGVHCVDLGESFPTSIYLQKSASIQPRTSPSKVGGKFNSIFIRLVFCNILATLANIRSILMKTSANCWQIWLLLAEALRDRDNRQIRSAGGVRAAHHVRRHEGSGESHPALACARRRSYADRTTATSPGTSTFLAHARRLTPCFLDCALTAPKTSFHS